MSTNQPAAASASTSTVLNVAIAVIHYQDQYLLGFRHSAQHQGNRYEFVGGKIESNESPISALVREVEEETGLDIRANSAVKMGRLHHDYRDKKVCLHVYRVVLTDLQFKKYRYADFGLEGQALSWVPKSHLLAGHYPLPDANKTILAWLQLPTQLVITFPLAQFEPHFMAHSNAPALWLEYHQQHIPKNAWVYVRTKASQPLDASLITQLQTNRPDIQYLLPSKSYQNIQKMAIHQQDNDQDTYPPYFTIKACHLTHSELMVWATSTHSGTTNSLNKESNQSLSLTQPLIVSCHDEDSIYAANQLAAVRLQQHLPPVLGIFLSPVLATQSHPDDIPLGWGKWSSLAQLADMPVIALGGLSPNLYEQGSHYGASSIAGIRAFMAL